MKEANLEPVFEPKDGYGRLTMPVRSIAVSVHAKALNFTAMKYTPPLFVYAIVSDFFTPKAAAGTGSFGGCGKVNFYKQSLVTHNLFWWLQDFLKVMQNKATVLLFLTHHIGDNSWNPSRITLCVKTAR